MDPTTLMLLLAAAAAPDAPPLIPGEVSQAHIDHLKALTEDHAELQRFYDACRTGEVQSINDNEFRCLIIPVAPMWQEKQTNETDLPKHHAG